MLVNLLRLVRVLAGTLTYADRRLLNRTLTPAERELMPDLLKCMQQKSNPAVMAEIAAALAKSITQQELFFKIHRRLGGKSPGPSGVTLDILVGLQRICCNARL